DRTPEITFSLTFVSSMSELLKRMILNGDGVGWLPQYSIQRELTAQGMTLFLVEQNARHALNLSDRAYVMVNGQIRLSGSGQ
ncbi:LysR family transcriptional regulator, partial [Klebsiella pneumoniae]